MQAIKNNQIKLKIVTEENFEYTNNTEKISLMQRLQSILKSLKFTNNKLEVSPMEKKEAKNFNKKIDVTRSEILANANTRIYTYIR